MFHSQILLASGSLPETIQLLNRDVYFRRLSLIQLLLPQQQLEVEHFPDRQPAYLGILDDCKLKLFFKKNNLPKYLPQLIFLRCWIAGLMITRSYDDLTKTAGFQWGMVADLVRPSGTYVCSWVFSPKVLFIIDIFQISRCLEVL